MGDPRKQRKKYDTPRHPWRREQLEAELKLLGEYGLRNKRELWRYKTMLSKIRAIARSLLGKPESERRKLESQYLPKLVRLGLLPENAEIDDILDLEVKDLLERRLQTLVFRLNLAKSVHQARQLVTHGHIMVGDRVVSVPGYLVNKNEEPSIRYAPQSPLNEQDHPVRSEVRSGKA
ncbi:TPA: 30S ribosomal protein S4 [Candidatus Bathyarchaeota archaeon]|nr:30S ribosomal protein S4 [Candidatus Bathyarchaeota archaeon]